MKQINLPICIALFWMCCCTLNAQAEYKCQELLDDGLRLMKQKNYGEAGSLFWAALITCKEKPPGYDLTDLIRQCQSNQLKDLEAAVQKEKVAYQTALAAQREAETAKVSEEKARKEAEANAKLARERGIKAESLRLALLSDMIRQKGRKSDALVLAYLALQMAGPDTMGVMMRAFGEAVRDSLTEYWFDSPNTVESIQQVASGQTVLVKTSDGSYYIIKRSGETGSAARVTQLDAKFTQVVPAPGGDLFIGWGRDNDAQLLDAAGAVAVPLSGHTEAIRCAAFSSDGNLVATGSRDNTARLWDRSGKSVALLTGHTANIQDMIFSPDGAFLLTRSADGTARSWDTRGNPLATLEQDGKFLHRAWIIPIHHRIAGLFSDGSAALWSPQGKLIATIKPAAGEIKDLVFSTTYAGFAARLSTGRVELYNSDGLLQHALTPASTTTGLARSADGVYSLTWGKDRVARLWDSQGTLKQEFSGHQQDIISADLPADNEFVLTASKDGTAKLWDSGGNILTEWVPGSNTPAQFSLDRPGVLLALNGGRSLAFSPFSGNIYQSIDREKMLSGAEVSRLIGEFNVQFSEGVMEAK